MDENNYNNPKENNTPATADAYEQTNNTVTKPVSAFDIPADNKTDTASAQNAQPGTSYYSNPEDFSTNYYTDNTSSNLLEETSTGFAIASLVLGILSIVTCSCCGIGILLSILSIIFGCLQPKDSFGNKPGMATAGIITSCVGILFNILFIALLALPAAISELTIFSDIF